MLLSISVGLSGIIAVGLSVGDIQYLLGVGDPILYAVFVKLADYIGDFVDGNCSTLTTELCALSILC